MDEQPTPQPAPSPAGRGEQRGKGPEKGTPASSPLFWNLPLSHPFQLPLSPSSQGKRVTGLGFPLSFANTSQVQLKEVRLSWEGRA